MWIDSNRRPDEDIRFDFTFGTADFGMRIVRTGFGRQSRDRGKPIETLILEELDAMPMSV